MHSQHEVLAEPTTAGSAVRVYVVVGEFPLPSETFILDQIDGLSVRGFSVTVIGLTPRSGVSAQTVQSPHARYSTVYVAPPRSAKERIKRLVALIRRGLYGSFQETLTLSAQWKLARGAVTEVGNLLGYAEAFSKLPPPDLVICHFGVHGDLMVRVRKALGEHWPVLTHFHGYDISRLVKRYGPSIYSRLMREGDRFLPACRAFVARLTALGADESRIFVIRMGVNPMNRTLARKASKDGTYTLFSVGRLVEKKGHIFAIRALGLVKAKVRLVIVGAGEALHSLQAEAISLGISDRVEFRGARPRQEILSALQTEADAFLLPSVVADDGDVEASPVAISEAMALSLPVVATVHGGIPELVVDGETGFLVPERDPSALADAIERLCNDRSLGIEMGRKGHERLKGELSLDYWNDRMADLVSQYTTQAKRTKSRRPT